MADSFWRWRRQVMYLNVNAPILDDLIPGSLLARPRTVDAARKSSTRWPRGRPRALGIENGIEMCPLLIFLPGTGWARRVLPGRIVDALHALMQTPVSPQRLAEEACISELDLLQKPWQQDQFMAAYGGPRCCRSQKMASRRPQYLWYGRGVEELENNLLLFYTGEVRLICPHRDTQPQDDATKRKTRRVVPV